MPRISLFIDRSSLLWLQTLLLISINNSGCATMVVVSQCRIRLAAAMMVGVVDFAMKRS